MLGLLALDPDRIARLVTALLAVLGGYLAGFVLAGVCAHFLDRWLTGGKSMNGLHTAARHVGGIAGAVLVALIVFGGIGDGEGPGGGPGTTPTSGTGPGVGPNTLTSSKGEALQTAQAPPEPDKPVEEVVQVTVLSGADVRDQRFYLVDDGRNPLTLAEVQDRVRGKRVGPGGVSIAVRLAPRTDRNNAGVRDLEAWARDAGMRVILPRKE